MKHSFRTFFLPLNSFLLNSNTFFFWIPKITLFGESFSPLYNFTRRKNPHFWPLFCTLPIPNLLLTVVIAYPSFVSLFWIGKKSHQNIPWPENTENIPPKTFSRKYLPFAEFVLSGVDMLPLTCSLAMWMQITEDI